MDPDVVVGIDVAGGRRGGRPCVGVVVRRGCAVRRDDWLEMVVDGPEAARAFAAWAASHAPVAVGIDAPQHPNTRRRAGSGERRPRRCDEELAQRGIAVYQVPTAAEAKEGDGRRYHWMRAGWWLFEALRGHRFGFELPAPGSLPGLMGQPPAVLEVYPYATFVTLMGGLPPSKSTRAGMAVRVATLLAQGLRWHTYYDHDSVDALAAALTARRFADGKATALGREREALLWLPVGAPPHAGRERYAGLGAERLRACIEAAAALD